MRVGALALLRNKCHTCVRTSSDSWSFGLKKHAILQEEVLTVFVSGKGYWLIEVVMTTVFV